MSLPAQRSNTPLKFLIPGWFSLVMGISGLALAWRSAAPVLGELATGVALVLALLALLVFVVLAAASLLRWQRYPQALADDLQHPVRHAFVATVPVSLLLLATAGHALGISSPTVSVVWWAGSLLQLWATVWVLGRWLLPVASGTATSGLWPGITPVLFIPVVGNVLAPLAGLELGHTSWAAAQFGIGLVFWPVVWTLLLVRRFSHSALPERLLPTWFITVAPPAVIGLALLQFQAPAWLAHACWGVALFAVLWAGTQLTRTISQPFGLPFWGLSFPFAAFATLSLKLAVLTQTGQTAGVVLLAVASLIVLGLGFATVRGLRNGSLLAPEPVAQIVPAST